jgi:hypothetical protein
MKRGRHLSIVESKLEHENFALWFKLSDRHEDDQRKSWDGPDWSGSRIEVD